MTELSVRRKSEVIDLAEFIALEYAIEGKINPRKIATEKGIPVIDARYKNYFDGMLMYCAEQFYIYCNLDKVGGKETPRARFTIAHELGHYFLPEHRQVLLSGQSLHHGSNCEYSSTNLVEREADLFASHLLMPTALFEAQIRRKKPKTGIEEILYLKEVFGVSIMSTAIRMVNTELVPCAIFIWNNDRTLKWHRKSSSFVRGNIGKAITSAQYLRESATDGAFSSMDGIQYSGATVSAFFENISQSSYRNALVKEEAIRLGEYGVLTLIMADGDSLAFDAVGSK